MNLTRPPHTIRRGAHRPAAPFPLALLTCAACMAAAPDPRKTEFTLSDDRLRLTTPRWEMEIARADGRLLALRDTENNSVTLRGGPALWTIERDRAEPVGSAGVTAFNYRWSQANNRLVLTWERPEAKVTLSARVTDDGIEWRPEVQLIEGTMLGWVFPDGIEFDTGALRRFIFPDNLGVAFLPGFFLPYATGYSATSIGPAGLEHILGTRCAMRPVNDPRVPIVPGRDAAGWLPEWYRKEMTGWQVCANRTLPPERCDLALVESTHGPWLSGHRLGGTGWMFRFGGFLNETDFRLQIAGVMMTLARVWPEPPQRAAPQRDADAPPRIGVLAFAAGVAPGHRLPSSAERWVATLRAHDAWMRIRGVEIAEIRDMESLHAALTDPTAWRAIVNPAAESFPAAHADSWKETLDAIAAYVRAGGVWWEAGGGYTFHSVRAPARDALVQSAGRHFCDFAALESDGARWEMFGVQPPDAIYTPPTVDLATGGEDGARLGRYRHRFNVCVPATENPWRSPAFCIETRQTTRLREGMARYREINRLGIRALGEKLPGNTLARLKRSVLLKLDAPTLAEQAAIVRRLPVPMLVHISNYLRGGFDKQYPDHLPPHPDTGTAEDLSALIAACRETGHLLMPYTNPTWWCIEPKGPTFETAGDAPLSRDLAGALIPEQYGSAPNRGYSLCAWHPAARAANDVIRSQFTQLHPADLLFQDQVGARGHRCDTNPAAPHPGAYLEGIHRIARIDCRHAALATEDGHERLIDFETAFCGLSWPWLRNRGSTRRLLYEDVWPEGTWQIEPITLYLAHDAALFYHHDLGGFVRDRRDLALSVALGYGLSFHIRSAAQLDGADGRWLECLHRIQHAVCARVAGTPLIEFNMLNPHAPRSAWGSGIEIVANLDAHQSLPIDDQCTIAPEGFLARRTPDAPAETPDDMEAGVVTRLGGREFGAQGKLVIREKSGDAWNEWVTELPILD